MAQSYDRRINLYINIDGKQVQNNAKSIRAEMSKIVNAQALMTIGSEKYLAEGRKIQQLQKILAKHREDLANINSAWSFKGMAQNFNKYIGVVATGVAAVAGFIYKMNEAVQASDNFNDKLANLSAITGLAGGDLEWLGNKAKEFSTSTLDGGINITKNADDIVDAFTKMGSARPELLKNKDALAEVTKQALILAEAGKIDLDSAIQSVAASMNQFNLDASQSPRIINAIAAGALEGSAEINDLTGSMKNVGTVAADSNMTLEQTVAALEVLGEKQLKGEEAGTKLRGALLKMKDAGVGYASGQFNMRDALEEVNAKLKAQGSELERDALKSKVFGIENITAGTILLQNVEKYDKLTIAVTGTNVAMQQAAKNTNTDMALKKQAINEYHRAAIELGQNLSPAVTALYRGLGSLTRSFSEMIAVPVSDKLRQEQFEVNNLVHSIVSVNDNQKIRNGLISELQQKYPDFIGNIDAEKVSNDELLKKLNDVNKAYLERIKIAVNEEDITANEKEMQKIWKEQRELIKDIDSQYQSLVVDKKENATLDEKIAAIAKTNSTVQGYGSVSYASNAGIANLQKERLLNLTEKENKLSKEYNDLLKERETINPTAPINTTPSNGAKPTPTTPSGALTDEQRKERLDKLEATNNTEMAAIKKRYIEGKTSEDQYNADLLNLEIAFLNQKLTVYKKGSKEYTDAENDLAEKQVKGQKDLKDKLLKYTTELLDAQAKTAEDHQKRELQIEDQRWEDEKKSLKQQLIEHENLSADEIKINEVINKLIEQKELVHKVNMGDINLKYLDKKLSDNAISYSAQLVALETSYKNEEITTEQYNARKKELTDNELKDFTGFKQKYNILNEESLTAQIELFKTSEFYALLSEEEKEQGILDIREKYNQKREKQYQDAAQKELDAIRKKFTDEQEIAYQKGSKIIGLAEQMGQGIGDAFGAMFDDSQKKSAAFFKGLTEALLNTAQTLVREWYPVILAREIATKGPAGIGTAALYIGLIEVAFGIAKAAVGSMNTSKKESSASTTKHAAGGFTHGEKTYIAGEAGKEWISPNWMVDNPITGPIIANLEDMRTNPVTVTQAAVQASKSNRSGGDAAAAMVVNTSPDTPLAPSTAADSGMTNDIALKLIDVLENWDPTISIELLERRQNLYNKVTKGGLK